MAIQFATASDALWVAYHAVADFEGETARTEEILRALIRLHEWVIAQGEDLEDSLAAMVDEANETEYDYYREDRT